MPLPCAGARESDWERPLPQQAKVTFSFGPWPGSTERSLHPIRSLVGSAQDPALSSAVSCADVTKVTTQVTKRYKDHYSIVPVSLALQLVCHVQATRYDWTARRRAALPKESEIETYGSWPVIPCELDHNHLSGNADPVLDRTNDPHSGTSNRLTYGDLELLDPDTMETILMGVFESHHEKSKSTSLAACPDSMNTTVTRPPLAKIGVKALSDHGPPLPEMVVDISGERRRAQNRAAQRAHRDRQKRYVAQLEKRFFALQANYTHLDERYQTVQKEYEALVSFVRSQPTPTESPLLRTVAEPSLTFSFPDLQPLSEFSLCVQELDRIAGTSS
ncbi:hypothetical protein CLCR_07180 [Cladophialophora carrionii]|uniref:BZIP domain-containing protein n=1 Tax=Cladophialophora carrionii TaxID=86049 RepID=A0A1C1CPV0_9EURO|nr:hypothetical protein CLCR_07180 [Cladophialophora carrionii]